MILNKNNLFAILFLCLFIGASFSFKKDKDTNSYTEIYYSRLSNFNEKLSALISLIEKSDLSKKHEIEKIKTEITLTRVSLKPLDLWFRYLEPVSYKKINGPLPVEWETEVFEKFEKPYKRQGAGLTLAELYLEEETVNKDSLLLLIKASVEACETYKADSITNELKSYHHFYLCNRLYLLNLATIYTTGFECPDPNQVIPELRAMMSKIGETYISFNTTFAEAQLTDNYLTLYKSAVNFINTQPTDPEQFDHFTFVKDYVNPLFAINQQLILNYGVVSKSYADYTLNKSVNSIFSKKLYSGQNTKGIFMRVYNAEELAEIETIGKQLFYDPILSGNNKRSCASCHKPTECFTDTVARSAPHFNQQEFLPRNTPSLVNSQYNHLLMLDGKHISLQDQAKAVITNTTEMGCGEKELLNKILSCKDYKKAFKKFLKFTPQEKEIGMQHISSALTLYYSKFGNYYSPFDKAMNENAKVDEDVKKGFNIFMSKAQCATCHFAPQFNGVKPPYVGSEFEVLGTPADTIYQELSNDKGRYVINPAFETKNAFRTGTIRNAAKTAPYMHNGVFKTLNQVIEFYNTGGGAAHGLKVENQTLSQDSLHLTLIEKKYLISFIRSLNEDIHFETPPEKLPISKIKIINNRKVSGEY